MRPIRIYRGVLLLFFIHCNFASTAQANKVKFFVQEELRFFKEQTDTSKTSQLIKTQDCNSIVFSFFEEFNDTLALFINNKKRGEWLIQTKDNPSESTGYSGIAYEVSLKRKKNIISIRLLSQKKYIKFKIDKTYPLYSIQRYNNVWYVNGRKYKMILK
jgi:hypothetical protein